jgi:hypothetical protein
MGLQMRTIITLGILILLQWRCTAQYDTVSRKVNMIVGNFVTDLPVMDYAKRYGWCNKAGAQFLKKTEKNLLWGARFHFIFGRQIREDSVLWNVYTSNGNLIDKNGNLGNVGLFQRGYQVGLDFGYRFSFWQVNANSGPYWLGSYGFMQHKINIFDRDQLFGQLNAEYKKGYDRLTNGLYTEQQVGYMYLSKSRTLCVYAALGFNYARTGGRREWLFDVRRTGLDVRNDASIAGTVGWIIPIFKKNVEEVYY